jgi:hypothetical protein
MPPATAQPTGDAIEDARERRVPAVWHTARRLIRRFIRTPGRCVPFASGRAPRDVLMAWREAVCSSPARLHHRPSRRRHIASCSVSVTDPWSSPQMGTCCRRVKTGSGCHEVADEAWAEPWLAAPRDQLPSDDRDPLRAAAIGDQQQRHGLGTHVAVRRRGPSSDRQLPIVDHHTDAHAAANPHVIAHVDAGRGGTIDQQRQQRQGRCQNQPRVVGSDHPAGVVLVTGLHHGARDSVTKAFDPELSRGVPLPNRARDRAITSDVQSRRLPAFFVTGARLLAGIVRQAGCLVHRAGQRGVNSQSSRLTPWMNGEWSISGSPTAWMSGTCSNSSRKAIVISRRARLAPRQKWGPPAP